MGETGYDQIASVGTRYSDTSGFVDLQEVTIFDDVEIKKTADAVFSIYND